MTNNSLEKYNSLPSQIIHLYISFNEYFDTFHKTNIRTHYFNILFKFKNLITKYTKNENDTNLFIKNYLNTIVCGNDYLSDFGYNNEYFKVIYKTLFEDNFDLINNELNESVEILSNEEIDKFARISYVFQIVEKNKIFKNRTALLLSVIFSNFMFYTDNSFDFTFIFLHSILFSYTMYSDYISRNFDEWIIHFCDLLYEDIQYNMNHVKKYNEIIESTKNRLSLIINNNQKEKILQFLFNNEKFTASNFSQYLNVTRGQAIRYLNKFIENKIITKNNKQRCCEYTFIELHNYLYPNEGSDV